MNNKNKNTRSFMLRSLGVGDSCDFPMELYTAISADCTRYGKMWGKKFTMKSNNEVRTVTVTRTA